MPESKSLGSRLADAMNLLALLLVALAMLFPFVYVFAISFSTMEDVLRGGVILWPRHWSPAAYRFTLASPAIIRSLGVSLFLATVGTLVNLAMTASMAYALANRNLLFRRFFLVLVLLPMLFAPGMIPRYLVVRATGLINSLWAMIIPSAISVWSLLVMRNFLLDLPQELLESAEIDGATDLQILGRIVLPLSKPVMAAIGLFYAVGHWNAYFNAILYLTDAAKWPVQVLMRLIVLMGQTNAVGDVSPLDATVVPPPFTIQMATVIVATVPILIVYPLLQKYFTKGVLTGAIKG
mgnify:CR=1 FL=1